MAETRHETSSGRRRCKAASNRWHHEGGTSKRSMQSFLLDMFCIHFPCCWRHRYTMRQSISPSTILGNIVQRATVSSKDSVSIRISIPSTDSKSALQDHHVTVAPQRDTASNQPFAGLSSCRLRVQHFSTSYSPIIAQSIILGLIAMCIGVQICTTSSIIEATHFFNDEVKIFAVNESLLHWTGVKAWKSLTFLDYEMTRYHVGDCSHGYPGAC